MIFKKAIPIFPREISKKMNSLAVFKLTAGTLRGTELHVAAADFYQLKINVKRPETIKAGEYATFDF